VSERAAPLGISATDRGRMDEVQRLAAGGAAAVPALVALLVEPSWVVRRAVVAALARAGNAAIGPLCAVLRTQRDDEGRLAATVDALVAYGGDVEPAILALATEDVVPAVLCDVAQILGRRKSRVGVELLAEWSRHADDNVAVAAIEALGRLGGPIAVGSLLAAVQSDNFFRVFPAISVLGQCGELRAVAPLARLLGAPHYATEVAAALGRTGQLAAVAPLAAQLIHADDSVVQATAGALVELRRRYAERLGESAAVLHALRDAAPAGAPARLDAAMSAADRGDRVAAAVVRAWLRDLRSVEALVEMLDGEGSVAEEALHALRSIGVEAEPYILRAVARGTSDQRSRLLPLLGTQRASVPELVICLSDPDPSVRALACDALARVGDASAVAPLFALVGDADARVVQAAVGAVQSLGSDAVKDHALSAARQHDSRKRRAALRILAYFGYPEAIEPLLSAIADADERIRDAAASGLALVDDPRGVAALLAASRHASAATRASACRALGSAAGEDRVIGALRAALADEDAWVRYYACQALGKLHAVVATAQISALLEDTAGQVRVAAVEAMARLGGSQALETLERAARSSDPDLRAAALLGLGALRRPEALPMLLAAAASADVTTRLVALAAIAESPLPEALAALMRAGADVDEQVRSAALGFVAARPGMAPTRWLIDQLERGEREAALAALAQPVEGRIEGVLVALESADAELAGDLVQALLRMRRAHGNAAIEAALHLGNVHGRRAAAAALAGLGTAEARAALSLAATADADPEVRRIAGGGG
jgi:HEAT repeat protein